MGLPTQKTVTQTDFKSQTIMIVGQPKIGKTKLAAEIYPNAIWATTEDGHKHVSIFEYPIKNWQDFANLSKMLLTQEHNFEAIIIDVLDHLIDFAKDEIVAEEKVKALADLKFGKGTEMLRKKLMRPILLLSRKMPIVFITHQKERMQKDKGLEWTVSATSMSESVEKTFTGMCDIILNCYQDENGQRVMRTKPTKYVQAAGDRTGMLPEKLPLSAKALRQAYMKPNDIEEMQQKVEQLKGKIQNGQTQNATNQTP